MFGRVDIAIMNAGLQEVGNWFDPSLDLESVKAVSFPFLSYMIKKEA